MRLQKIAVGVILAFLLCGSEAFAYQSIGEVFGTPQYQEQGVPLIPTLQTSSAPPSSSPPQTSQSPAKKKGGSRRTIPTNANTRTETATAATAGSEINENVSEQSAAPLSAEERAAQRKAKRRAVPRSVPSAQVGHAAAAVQTKPALPITGGSLSLILLCALPVFGALSFRRWFRPLHSS